MANNIKKVLAGGLAGVMLSASPQVVSQSSPECSPNSGVPCTIELVSDFNCKNESLLPLIKRVGNGQLESLLKLKYGVETLSQDEADKFFDKGYGLTMEFKRTGVVDSEYNILENCPEKKEQRTLIAYGPKDSNGSGGLVISEPVVIETPRRTSVSQVQRRVPERVHTVNFRDSEICYVPSVSQVSGNLGSVVSQISNLPRVGENSEMRLWVDNSPNPINYTFGDNMSEIRGYIESGARDGICILNNSIHDDYIRGIDGNGNNPFEFEKIGVKNGQALEGLESILPLARPTNGPGIYDISLVSPKDGTMHHYGVGNFNGETWNLRTDYTSKFWEGETTKPFEDLTVVFQRRIEIPKVDINMGSRIKY